MTFARIASIYRRSQLLQPLLILALFLYRVRFSLGWWPRSRHNSKRRTARVGSAQQSASVDYMVLFDQTRAELALVVDEIEQIERKIQELHRLSLLTEALSEHLDSAISNLHERLEQSYESKGKMQTAEARLQQFVELERGELQFRSDQLPKQDTV